MNGKWKYLREATAKDFDSIIFSAGKIGYQVQVNVCDLEKFIRIGYEDLVVSK